MALFNNPDYVGMYMYKNMYVCMYVCMYDDENILYNSNKDLHAVVSNLVDKFK